MVLNAHTAALRPPLILVFRWGSLAPRQVLLASLMGVGPRSIVMQTRRHSPLWPGYPKVTNQHLKDNRRFEFLELSWGLYWNIIFRPRQRISITMNKVVLMRNIGTGWGQWMEITARKREQERFLLKSGLPDGSNTTWKGGQRPHYNSGSLPLIQFLKLWWFPTIQLFCFNFITVILIRLWIKM